MSNTDERIRSVDVLCSSRRFHQSHQGNQIYASTVSESLKQHQDGNGTDLCNDGTSRSLLAASVVAHVESTGARFLAKKHRHNKKWIVLPDDLAKAWVCHDIVLRLCQKQDDSSSSDGSFASLSLDGSLNSDNVDDSLEEAQVIAAADDDDDHENGGCLILDWTTFAVDDAQFPYYSPT